MSAVPLPENEALIDLLCERSACGLDGEAQGELRSLLASADRVPEDLFDDAAALFAVAFVSNGDGETLPTDVGRMMRQVAASFSSPAASAAEVAAASNGRSAGEAGAIDIETARQQLQRSGSVPPLAWAGWLAAAACLLVAFIVTRPEGSPTAMEQKATLLASAQDAFTAAWKGLDDVGLSPVTHPLNRGVGGDVVWSDERDAGVMTLAGLAPNDPEEFQYQLWIFDEERRTGDLPQFAVEGLPILTQRPVDGGVFDCVPGADGTAVVPIDAKLPVGKAAIFAITKEPPGGVVVSDRDIVFVALRPAGQG